MEADKLGGITVKGMASDDRRQGGGPIYQTKFLSSQWPNISKEKMPQNKEARKESVTEELYHVRNEAFITLYCGGQKAVTAIPTI
jgi:hypothetical protein